MSKESKSGNPAKQPRPDGSGSEEVTQAFPPALSCVVTEVACEVVPFAFPGGKALDLQLYSGPLVIHCHIPVATAEVVIDAIRQAKMKAETSIAPATMDEVAALGNGAKG